MNARPGETAQEIAARYGMRLAPGAKLTVCPPFALSEDAFEPVPLRDALKRQVQARALGARLRAADKAAEQPAPRVSAPKPLVPRSARAPVAPRRAKPSAPKSYQHATAIREMAARGMTDGEIGAKLGIARKTVTNARCKLRIPSGYRAVPRPGSPSARVIEAIERREACREQFLALHAQGLSDRRIGKKLGLQMETARDYRKFFGLEPNETTPAAHKAAFDALVAEHGAEIVRLNAEGVVDRVVAERFGRSPACIRRVRAAVEKAGSV